MQCGNCGSLQTERPYWLDECYGTSNIAATDMGTFTRAINNLSRVWLSLHIIGGFRGARIVDYGGGGGLLCRMLRDFGYDARLYDRYAVNEHARGFTDPGDRPDVMCSFEVAEHFPDPSAGMAEILGRGARLCIVGTETYGNAGPEWDYLVPLTGQHVFFYSHKGMQLLAGRHGYHYERVGALHYFLERPLSRLRGALLWRAVRWERLRWTRAYLMFTMTYAHSDADQAAVLRRAARDSGADGPTAALPAAGRRAEV